ncbi:PucR family transcriptional regulator [Rhodococcus sp. NPDC056743]|uniref:PucR family transcriptional regulator n=1 Tax=Rhodococcus sp. NPDC056743 TaxID=3345934 RepID=UPI003671F2EE
MTSAETQGAECSEAVDRRLVEVCLGMNTRIDEIALRIATKLCDQETAYEMVMPLDQLAAAVSDNIAGLIDSVRLNRVLAFTVPHTTGRRRAEQELPLETVLSAYRLGVMYIWEELVSGCEESDRRDSGEFGPMPASRALLGSASVLWAAFDMYAHELAAAYQAVACEQLQRNHRRRQSLLNMLFSGDPGSEQTLVEVAGQLRMPSTGTFVVLATDPVMCGTDAPESARVDLADLAIRSVWKSESRSDLGLIALNGSTDRRRLIQNVARLELGRVGISRPFTGLSTIPAAVTQARLARNAGREGRQIVTDFDAAQVAALIISSPDLANGLQQHVFGALRDMTTVEQDVLIGTLRAWFDSAGSTEAVAAALHCHPNTVRYRLNKLMNLLQRDLKAPLDVVELYLASEARRLNGSRAVAKLPSTHPPAEK